MTVDYGFEREIVVMTFQGDTSDEEIRRVFAHAWSDRAFSRPARLLLDVRGSSSLPKRSPDSMRGLVDFIESIGDDIGYRLAVVVKEGVQFGMVRMASAFADMRRVDMRVFVEMDVAREWLLEPPRPEDSP